jgi:2-phosphoglycerate kinase
MAKRKEKIQVVQKEEGVEVPAKIIADSIVEISNGIQKLNSTRLTRKAIVTLINANSGIGKGDIEVVLNNLEALEQIWLKPKE